MDMTGAMAGRIISEVMEEEFLSQRAKDALRVVADLEQSRGHAAFHLLSLAASFDANLKLLRRQAVISNMELSSIVLRPSTSSPSSLQVLDFQNFGTGGGVCFKEAYSPTQPGGPEATVL